MAKPELGVKRRCASCGAAFYDLNREPIVCPKCGTEYVVEQPKPSRKRREPEPPKPVAKKPAEDSDDSEEAVDGEADDFLEEDLDEDEDVGEVIDGASSDEEET